MKEVSLAEKSDMPGMLAMAPSEPSGPKEYYPRVTLCETGGLEIPDEGEITLKFKKVRSEEETVDGKKKYRRTLDLVSILDIEDTSVEEPASNRGKDTENALDKLRDEKMAEEDEDEEGD